MIQVEHADLLINLSVLLMEISKPLSRFFKARSNRRFHAPSASTRQLRVLNTRAEAIAHLRVRPVSRRVNDLGD